jgi:calcineurin-like phosphoesterase family protein
MDFFTSDNHWFNSNVIGYQARPFNSVRHQDDTMVTNWNLVVGKNDRVIHLGDVFLGGTPEEARALISKLNGYKILVRGNHDANRVKMLEMGFDEVIEGNNCVLEVSGPHGPLSVWCNHFPKEVDDHRPKYVRPAPPVGEEFDFSVCGHVHGAWTVRSRICNVSVERWGYAPASVEQVLLALSKGDDQ